MAPAPIRSPIRYFPAMTSPSRTPVGRVGTQGTVSHWTGRSGPLRLSGLDHPDSRTSSDSGRRRIVVASWPPPVRVTKRIGHGGALYIDGSGAPLYRTDASRPISGYFTRGAGSRALRAADDREGAGDGRGGRRARGARGLARARWGR